MDNIEIAYKQLEQFYSEISKDRGRKVTFRQWFITIWLAIMVSLLTKKINISITICFLIVFLPIFLFWFLESLRHTFIRINEIKAKRIEEFIASENDMMIPLNYFYVSSYPTIKFSKKIMLLTKSFFMMETIYAFYFLISVTSFVFIIIMYYFMPC